MIFATTHQKFMSTIHILNADYFMVTNMHAADHSQVMLVFMPGLLLSD